MNHYPHHIGDFNNATRHLTRVERSLYRDMIELYYDTEQPLNSDTNKIARRILANSEEEHAAMLVVLDEFFVLQDDGWHNARCDAEIAKYTGQIEQASKAGKASAAKRSNQNKTNVQQTFNDRLTTVDVPLNQPEPEPEPINTPKPPAKTPGAEERFERLWLVYPKKIGKDAALKAFAKRKPDDALVDLMVKAVEQQKRSDAWLKDGGQFIPNPATWLNQGRWQDDVGPIAANSSGFSNPLFAGAI